MRVNPVSFLFPVQIFNDDFFLGICLINVSLEKQWQGDRMIKNIYIREASLGTNFNYIPRYLRENVLLNLETHYCNSVYSQENFLSEYNNANDFCREKRLVSVKTFVGDDIFVSRK